VCLAFAAVRASSGLVIEELLDVLVGVLTGRALDRSSGPRCGAVVAERMSP
jgi:hypothetical protein